MAHNVALTHRRKQRRHAGLFEFSDPAELTRRPAPQPDAVADDRWLALRSAIFELAAEARQLMLLHLEGLSLVEIEAVSGIRAGTVATRLSRLRARLSERLRRQGHSSMNSQQPQEDNEKELQNDLGFDRFV